MPSWNGLLLGGLTMVLLLTTSSSAAEPSWGNLKIRFVYDGVVPERPKLLIGRDKMFCGTFDLREESLVVERDGGLANVLVWLDAKIAAPPVHPGYDKSSKDKVGLDSRGCRFVPHVALLRTTQTLEMRNADPIAHNARFDGWVNAPFNFLLTSERSVETTLEKAERLPARIACSIHPWRHAYLLVQDHPYMAVSDPRGHVEINNLPTGKWTFVCWHERAGYLRSVESKGERREWAKGRVEIEIKSGENEQGEIKLKPELFETK